MSDIKVEITRRINRVYLGKQVVFNQSTALDKLTDTFTAGETINAHRVVYVASDGLLYIADSTDVSHIGLIVGISDNAANAGQQVTVVKRGIITNAGWGLTPGRFYFYNNSGILTLTPPATGFKQIIGQSRTANDFEINMFIPIIRG